MPRQMSHPLQRLKRALTLVIMSVAVTTFSSAAIAQRTPKQGISRLDAATIVATQDTLLSEALSKLEPTHPERSSIYFVGVASFAGQDVFLRELSAVQTMLAARFETGTRSLVLVNHRATTELVPLATERNLRIALQAVGERMDPERDILLLFITTHGLPGRLAFDFSPLFRMRDLTPDAIARMLDGSGIRNRVLVISACYSGSFMRALASPDSMIITAARADRTSFGCSNTRSWTYFGDAFFNRALQNTRNLATAFAQASATVAGWERAQRLTPSEPQIHIGTAIAPKLEALTADLERRAPALNPKDR
jgi:hypothetical protein